MIDYLTDWHTYALGVTIVMVVYGADKNELRIALCGTLFLIAVVLDWHVPLWPYVHDCSFAAREVLGK